MKRFGEHLIARDLLSAAQLDDALQSQVAFGGRLGTNLVELGYIDMNVLSAELSRLLETPIPPRSWLQTIDRTILRSAPLHLVKQHRVLPLHLEEDTLHIAMMDPKDRAQLDQLSTATSRRIRPYLLPELSMLFWLERHYGIARRVRYLNIGRDLEDGMPSIASSEPEHASELSPLEEGQELTDELTFADAYEASAPAEPTPTHPSIVAAKLEAKLREARDRDEIVAAGLSIARLYARAAALFVVHRQMVHGLQSEHDSGNVEGIVLPLEVPSMLTASASSGEPFRGAPFGTDARLLRELGRAGVKEIAVLPIRIRARVVNVLYVDNGEEPISTTSFAALLALTDCMAEAYERVILQRKLSAS